MSDLMMKGGTIKRKPPLEIIKELEHKHKIIDTQYQLDQMKDSQTKQYIKERLMAFHYVKGLVEAVIDDKEKEQIK